MKKLLILLLAAPLYSSEVLFINETDEFTDEVELILAVTSDDSNTIISKVVGAYCTAGIDEPYLLFNNGGLYTIDNYRTATFRFDKNEPYEQKFRVINNQLIALGKDPVNRFLSMCNFHRISPNFFIKICNYNKKSKQTLPTIYNLFNFTKRQYEFIKTNKKCVKHVFPVNW